MLFLDAIVRLKYGYFIVLEFTGEVRVCAVVSGYPAKVVAFPFDVRFTFIPDSASMLLAFSECMAKLWSVLTLLLCP